MNELVTVLMAVYNTREDWLRMAIESILSQSYTDIEFLIVLDRPTDNSAEIVGEYAKKDNRIKVLRNEINLGLTRSLNRGLEKARGKFIARMDSDDVAFADRIQKQAQYFEQHELDIMGAGIIKIDEDGKQIKDASTAYNPAQVNAALRYMDCVPHPTWFVRTEVYRELGGYRDVKCCEDYDLLLRARRRGFRIGNHEEPLLYYRINTKSITNSNRLRQFLTSCYLQEHCESIEDVTTEQIEAYLSRRLSPRAEEKFEMAVDTIKRGFDRIRKKRFITGICLVFSALFKSKYAVTDLSKILQVRLVLQHRKESGHKC